MDLLRSCYYSVWRLGTPPGLYNGRYCFVDPKTPFVQLPIDVASQNYITDDKPLTGEVDRGETYNRYLDRSRPYFSGRCSAPIGDTPGGAIGATGGCSGPVLDASGAVGMGGGQTGSVRRRPGGGIGFGGSQYRTGPSTVGGTIGFTCPSPIGTVEPGGAVGMGGGQSGQLVEHPGGGIGLGCPEPIGRVNRVGGGVGFGCPSIPPLHYLGGGSGGGGLAPAYVTACRVAALGSVLKVSLSSADGCGAYDGDYLIEFTPVFPGWRGVFTVAGTTLTLTFFCGSLGGLPQWILNVDIDSGSVVTIGLVTSESPFTYVQNGMGAVGWPCGGHIDAVVTYP